MSAADGDAATAWVDAVVPGERTGALEVVADQPWGRVARVPTARGPLWLKQPEPLLHFEPRLLALLAGRPLVPTVRAADPVTGRFLLADAGRSLCDLPGGTDPARYAAVWPAVGALQRDSAPLAARLVAAGVPDLRPGCIVQRFDEVVTAVGGTAPRGAVRRRLGRVAAALGRSRVPAGVDHNDLHDGNVVVGADGRVGVIDWGDAVVTHPFATLLVAERVLVSLLGVEHRDAPPVAAARRAYLAGFAALAPGEDLEHTARLAVAVAHVARAWAWHRALAAFAAAGANPGPFAGADREWLARAGPALAAVDPGR